MARESIVVWGVGTTRTLRAHWALHELGLSYETHEIGSRTGETQTDAFRSLNPRQKIPVLQLGSLTLAESAAIVTALAEQSADGTLIPKAGTAERALYYQWCFFVMTELDAHTLYVMRRHQDLAELYGEAPNAIAAAKEYFAWQSEAAATELRERGPYLLGDAFTGADILLTTCLDWALVYGLPLAADLTAYRARIVERPAYRAAFQHNFAALIAAHAAD
jgi:glutathione S-transferase